MAKCFREDGITPLCRFAWLKISSGTTWSSKRCRHPKVEDMFGAPNLIADARNPADGPCKNDELFTSFDQLPGDARLKALQPKPMFQNTFDKLAKGIAAAPGVATFDETRLREKAKCLDDAGKPACKFAGIMHRDGNTFSVCDHPSTLDNFGAKQVRTHVMRREGLCGNNELFEEPDALANVGTAVPASAFDAKLPDGNPKTKFGILKPAVSAIPPSAILYLGQVMVNGRAKYGPMNWRDDAVSVSTYYDAIGRHLLAFFDGQDIDGLGEDGEIEEGASGQPHLAHVMACCAILLDAKLQGKLIDDRPTKGKLADLIKTLTKKEPSK